MSVVKKFEGISFHSTRKNSLTLSQHPATREARRYIYIMKYARDCKLFTDKELAIINYCRLYLHVTTVSELFDASGQQMIPHLFQCTQEPWFNPDTYITLQKRPTQYHIRTSWQKLCRQWATSTGHIAALMDLGRWITHGTDLRHWRQTYVNPLNMQRIYHWRDDRYWEYLQEQVS
jgi:hypothetical protein